MGRLRQEKNQRIVEEVQEVFLPLTAKISVPAIRLSPISHLDFDNQIDHREKKHRVR